MILRAIAADLGIVHLSLYNHDKDRSVLPDILAARGFRMVADRLKTSSTPRTFVRGFTAFALEEANFYGVMMGRANARIEVRSDLKVAIGQLISLSAKVLAPRGSVSQNTDNNGLWKTDVRRDVMRIWMTIQGALLRHCAGMLAGRDPRAFIDELEAI